MPRSTSVRRKRGKVSAASKLRWRKMKEARLSTTPTIYSDINDTSQDEEQEQLPERNSTETLINNEDISNSSDEMELRKPDSNLRTYVAGCSSKTNNTQKEYGTISSDECDRIDDHVLEYESTPKQPSLLTGNRIVDLGYVLECTLDIQYRHAKVCTFGKLYIKDEIRTLTSMVSTVVLCCTSCDEMFRLNTEDPNASVSIIDTGVVWGTLATGSTYSHLDELISCVNIPMMSEKQFNKIEVSLGEEWKSSLWRSMEAAGVEEREFALKNGYVCSDGTPWITVYIDGSWSKRSYGTNFNSLSGMIGIIGRHTGKLLYMAVRNKFCCVCARAENKNALPPPHVCYRNWDASAPAMESDMAVEGFTLSESMHGVRYRQFIADGDSSVFAKLKQKVPYGSEINKIECTNHALKNYGKHLHAIKKDTHINVKGRKLLTNKKMKELQKRAKCSIYEHAKSDKNIDMLRMDLKYGLHHVFGDHSHCREGICNSLGVESENQISELKTTFIYNHLHGALELLVRKAHLLIENENNNRAERLMNIVARFNMGKRLNLVQRGSYERRVYLAGLRYNKQFEWHSSPYKAVTQRSPEKYLKKFIQRNQAKVSRRLFSSKNLPSAKGEKRKLEVTKPSKNIDYGVNAETPEEDADLMKLQCESVLDRLKVNAYERDHIQLNTVGQFGNSLYESERRERLTASMFARVLKRRPSTPCHNIVKDCLGSLNFFSEATEYGIFKEEVAINLFKQKTAKNVEKSGLWIDLDHCFLAASPDGLIIEDDAVLEVKCLYSARELNASTINEVVNMKKGTCLENKNDIISLKRNHAYYYQIQGQLNITRRSKCYFIVYINDQIEIFIEEIQRDEKFWNENMLPKLIQFYTECIAPEIVRDNIGKGKRCVDPPYILDAIKNKTNLG